MTSSILRAFEPFTLTVNGPPAAWGGRYKLHFPSLSAVDSTACPSRVTVTFSSGSAQPQKCIGRLLCKTMWLLRMLGRRTSALPSKQSNDTAIKHTIGRIVPHDIATSATDVVRTLLSIASWHYAS